MGEVIKSTDYCDLLKQAKVYNGDSVYAIEKIFVKEKKTKEVRFVYYKKDNGGKENFIPRPLDLEEEHLVALLKEGINSGVIKKELLEKVFNEL
ncbi:hypothetical protein J22TS1_09090 [Siminovitchia terrae]|uniref:hypothetical protein n=1 Tax=Siminovitchia terrae TaxID=1914933 RepID=UPI001B28873C|nr:hypothetical protein [Siminovitchia terrae]GIN89858.1 hypothetical protein J22TS1_09090 [Siminovitchia terrae]